MSKNITMSIKTDTNEYEELYPTTKGSLVNGAVANATNAVNATSATKLSTGRTIRTNLSSTSTATFDGTSNITPGITGVLPVANGGTGSNSLSSLTSTITSSVMSQTDSYYMTEDELTYTGNGQSTLTINLAMVSTPVFFTIAFLSPSTTVTVGSTAYKSGLFIGIVETSSDFLCFFVLSNNDNKTSTLHATTLRPYWGQSYLQFSQLINNYKAINTSGVSYTCEVFGYK